MHMKDMCLKESEHLFIILGSRVNLVQGDLCSLLVAHYKWTLTIHKKIEIIPKRIWGLILTSSITFANAQKSEPREFESYNKM